MVDAFPPRGVRASRQLDAALQERAVSVQSSPVGSRLHPIGLSVLD